MSNRIGLVAPSTAQNEIERELIATQNAQKISWNTVIRFFDGWMRNMRLNLPYWSTESDVLDLQRGNGKPAIIIGAGPSLKKFDHLKTLSNREVTSFCCDAAWKRAREAGLTPTYVLNLDPDPKALAFFESQAPTTEKLILSCVANSKLRPMWGRYAYWFVDNLGLCQHECDVGTALSIISHKSIISTGGNVGCASMMVAHALGYSPICLIGMDMSFDSEATLDKTPYYDAIYDSLGEMSKSVFRKGRNPFWKNDYWVDYMFDVYRYLLLERVRLLKIRLINCSGQGAIHSNDRTVTCMEFSDFLKEYS